MELKTKLEPFGNGNQKLPPVETLGRPLNYRFLFYMQHDTVLTCHVKPLLMLLAPFIILL